MVEEQGNGEMLEVFLDVIPQRFLTGLFPKDFNGIFLKLFVGLAENDLII